MFGRRRSGPRTSTPEMNNEEKYGTGPRAESEDVQGSNLEQPASPPYQRTIAMLARAMRIVNQDRVPQHYGLNLEELRSMGAKTFEGAENPTDAESWLYRMEKIFEDMSYSDEQKFNYATSLLRGGGFRPPQGKRGNQSNVPVLRL